MVVPFDTSTADRYIAYYAKYRLGNLTVDGEYRREIIRGSETPAGLPTIPFELDHRSWYVSGSYRICRKLEVGTYHSFFYPLWDQDHSLPDNHIFDHAVTGKINLTHQWDLKIEGHFMDGYGSYFALRGFYPQDNPQGFAPKTNLLVVRTGWTF